MYKLIFLFLIVLFSFSVNKVDGQEPILITHSSAMDEIVFDGKWTDDLEWKQSSWDIISIQGKGDVIHLRTAHYDDYIYVMLDAVFDESIDHMSDRAMVCIDGKNDRNIISGQDDFCFLASLDGKQGFVYQGGDPLSLNGNFKKISYNDFIGIGTKSDLNDKYSKVPHTSYEFKIPIELFGRSDIYGFYVMVYDDSTKQYYNWPTGIVQSNLFKIPSPSSWGAIISPDKSIPEFDLPFLILLSSIFFVIYFTKAKKLFNDNRLGHKVFTKAKNPET